MPSTGAAGHATSSRRTARALGVEVDPQTRSAGLWLTTQGGQFFAAGVGGAIAGWRADLGIIDDPIRSREDAESKTVQTRNWNWYKYDFIPRLKPKARRVLIQTRWSEGDLAGMILDDEGEDWRVIDLKMEAEDANDPLGRKPGERLWPDWFTQKMVDEAKRDPRVWAALYQQRPAPETGDFFRRAWLHPVPKREQPPLKEMRIYGAIDYATSDQAGRRFHGPHGARHRPRRQALAARYLARAGIDRALDRGMVPAGEALQPAQLGGGARPDPGRRRPLPRAPGA